MQTRLHEALLTPHGNILPICLASKIPHQPRLGCDWSFGVLSPPFPSEDSYVPFLPNFLGDEQEKRSEPFLFSYFQVACSLCPPMQEVSTVIPFQNKPIENSKPDLLRNQAFEQRWSTVSRFRISRVIWFESHIPTTNRKPSYGPFR